MTCSSFSLSRTTLKIDSKYKKKHVWQQAADADSLFDIFAADAAGVVAQEWATFRQKT